jgi:hypothetical protein
VTLVSPSECRCIIGGGGSLSPGNCPVHGPRFRERWRAEMREHGIPEDKIDEIWEAGREAGRRAREAGCR